MSVQGRIINELRVAGITTVAAANTYVRDRFIADYGTRFTGSPIPPATPPVPSSPSAP